MPQQRLPHPAPETPPGRPVLAEQPARFLLLEREGEEEYRPRLLVPGTGWICPRPEIPQRRIRPRFELHAE